MIRNFLVCTDGSPYSSTALDYGCHFASLLRGRLKGLHVLDQRLMEGPLLADVSGAIGTGPYAAGLPQFRNLMEEKGHIIATAFKERARKDHLETTVILETGHPAHVILDQEVRTEMLILGQRGENEQFGGDMVGSTTERVIRRSIKPCMITPSQFRPIQSLLVAYDGSNLSSKGLQLAAEFAAAFQKPLTILTVAGDMPDEQAEQTVADALEIVAAHGCEAQKLIKHGQTGDAILEAAADTGTDVIVMGAYGHSRIREIFLGNATSSVLSQATVPVVLIR